MSALILTRISCLHAHIRLAVLLAIPHTEIATPSCSFQQIICRARTVLSTGYPRGSCLLSSVPSIVIYAHPAPSPQTHQNSKHEQAKGENHCFLSPPKIRCLSYSAYESVPKRGGDVILLMFQRHRKAHLLRSC